MDEKDKLIVDLKRINKMLFRGFLITSIGLIAIGIIEIITHL